MKKKNINVTFSKCVLCVCVFHSLSLIHLLSILCSYIMHNQTKNERQKWNKNQRCNLIFCCHNIYVWLSGSPFFNKDSGIWIREFIAYVLFPHTEIDQNLWMLWKFFLRSFFRAIIIIILIKIGRKRMDSLFAGWLFCLFV